MSSPFLVLPGDGTQRHRAIDPSKSFLVQAPAGSGKTELLIQRYLKLLSVVEKPERIQAITFTRKAAGEMRERILRALATARAGTEPREPHEQVTYELAQAVVQRDRELGWGLPDNPARMKLQTIDSFCGGIVAQMPWLARQGGMPQVTEDATPFYLKAAQRTVREVERESRYREPLARVLLHLDNNGPRVAKLISAMLARRDQWIEQTFQIDGESRVILERTLSEVVEEGFREVEELIPAGDLALIRQLIPGNWREIGCVLLTGKDEWRQVFNTTCGFPADRKEDKQRCTDLVSRLREIPDLQEALRFAKRLPPEKYTDEQWTTTKSIFECLKLAVAQLRLVFQEERLVDFTEVSQAARFALGRADDPTELALKLDARIEHLLIDEFQDTSISQFELTKQLTEGWQAGDGRTLFLVGDPMQSIYRFRNAEVGLFLQAHEAGVGEIRPEPLVLRSNYRSGNAIVEWVNRVFGAAFPARADEETGAIAYSPSAAVRPDVGAAVQFHAFGEKEDLAEAQTAVRLVQEAHREHPSGTVAILVRARSHLPAIVDQLKREKITFRAVDLDDLGERAVVRDLLSLTRALLHRGDRLSWLSVLRAPWCGLTLADLHALASKDERAMVYDLLQGDLSSLSADGQARSSHLSHIFDEAFVGQGRLPLRAYVERTWRALGGPWCYGERGSFQDAADYLDLLEANQRGSDLADFDGFAGKVSCLKAKADPTANEWLQLMTIHKAKGLEFDTVILPGLGKQGRADDLRLFLFHRGVMAPIKETAAESDPFYQYLAALERRRSNHETTRQLYVATTRARKRLHLMGAVHEYKESVRPRTGSFLAALWQGLSDEEKQPFLDRVTGQAAPDILNTRQCPIERVPLSWRPPQAAAPVLVKDDGPEIGGLEPPTFEWVGESLRHAGTVVHELLRRIARTQRREVDPRAVRRALSYLGVPPDELEQTARRVGDAVDKTLTSEVGRWILTEHKEGRHEMAVAGVVDGRIVRGTIDRTFVDKDGIRWIIDFKTSAHTGGGMAVFLDEQQRRYRPQLERYGKLLAPLGRPIRLGLYFPLLNEWREWAAGEETS